MCLYRGLREINTLREMARFLRAYHTLLYIYM